MEEKFKRDER